MTDPHCCGVLDLEALNACAAHGISCGPDQCARWLLAVFQLTSREESA